MIFPLSKSFYSAYSTSIWYQSHKSQ